MKKAKLTFSNGDTLIISNEQRLIPIIKYTKNNAVRASKDEIVEIWYHTDDALIPSIIEFLLRSEYFHLINNPDKVYNSSMVVTVENI